MQVDKWRGVLILGALADACGHKDKLIYSDDTVLTLALAYAILQCHREQSEWSALKVMKITQEVVVADEKASGLRPFSFNRRAYGDKTWKLLQSWTPNSAHEKGSWDTCGLVMKISPLACLQPSLSDVSIAGHYMHGGNSTAVFVAWLHVQILRHLLADNFLGWHQLWQWTNACTDPFLQASLYAAKCLPYKEDVSPYKEIFKQCGRTKAVVVYICALWFAMPYISGSLMPDYERMVGAIMAVDSCHDTDTIGKLAAELVGARFGFNLLYKTLKPEGATFKVAKCLEINENMKRIDQVAVSLSELAATTC